MRCKTRIVLDGRAVRRRASYSVKPSNGTPTSFLPRDACISAAYMPSYFVRPSVTFVHSVETNKRIFNFFSPSGSYTILVFPHQTLWQYFNGTPNWGVECRCGRRKSRFSTNIWLHRVLSAVRPPNVIHTAAPDHGKLVTLIAGKRHRLCSRKTDDEVFMTKKPA